MQGVNSVILEAFYDEMSHIDHTNNLDPGQARKTSGRTQRKKALKIQEMLRTIKDVQHY